jgi:hypothetical protein
MSAFLLVSLCAEAAPEVLGEMPWSEGWSGIVGVMADGAVVGWGLPSEGSAGRPLVRVREDEEPEVLAHSALSAAVSGDGHVLGWLVAPGDARLETRGKPATWRPAEPIEQLLSAQDRVVGMRSEKLLTDMECDGEGDVVMCMSGTFSVPVPVTLVDLQQTIHLPDCPYPGHIYDHEGSTWLVCSRELVPLPPATGSPGVRAGPEGRLILREGALIYEGRGASWTLPHRGWSQATLLAGGRIVAGQAAGREGLAWWADGTQIAGPLGWPLVAAPDGSFLAWHEGERIVRMDPLTGVRLDEVGHGRPIVALDASPHGGWLVTADQQGEVLVWDLQRRELEERHHVSNEPISVAVRDDGRFAVQTRDAQVLLRDVGYPETLTLGPLSRDGRARGVLLPEDGTLRVYTLGKVDVFEAEGRFLRREDAPRPELARETCQELDGARWCTGWPTDGGLWRIEGDKRELVPIAPAISRLRLVRGGLLLSDRQGELFVPVQGKVAGAPRRLPGDPAKLEVAWSVLARPTGSGRIELISLEGLPEAVLEPPEPPTVPDTPVPPVRRPGSGPPITLVMALDGTGSFRAEMPLSRQLAFELLDSLERAYTPDDRVGVVTFHHRYAQIRSPLVPLADDADATTLRERLAQVDIASKGASPAAPREYPDETGSDPSTGLLGALSLLEGVPGRRVILLVTDGVTMAPGPGLLRGQQGYTEARWPEVINELHPDVDAVLAASRAAAARAEAEGVEVWVLAVADRRSCDYARPAQRCAFDHTDLLSAGRTLLGELGR